VDHVVAHFACGLVGFVRIGCRQVGSRSPGEGSYGAFGLGFHASQCDEEGVSERRGPCLAAATDAAAGHAPKRLRADPGSPEFGFGALPISPFAHLLPLYIHENAVHRALSGSLDARIFRPAEELRSKRLCTVKWR
jgi:hypothetical protein